MDKTIIPPGMYCYNEHGNCPYGTTMILHDKIGPIEFDYCLFLKQGSMPNEGWDNNEFERIQKLLNQTEDELWAEDGLLGPDLLWDQCKECGINNDD